MLCVPRVFANDAALAAVVSQNDLDYQAPRWRVGNNRPERRRNLLIRELADKVVGVPSAENIDDLVRGTHVAGFGHYFETAFSRWKDELDSDPSYLLPTSSTDEPALVPFVCTKTEAPRSDGLAAEIACYSADFETPIDQHTAEVLRDDLGCVLASVEHMVAAAEAQDRGVAYALTCHPGHHAGPSYSSGFCYVNNACVACRLLAEAGCTPALVDVDFHGGNGSWDIVCAARDAAGPLSRMHYRSLQCAGVYPWVDMGADGMDLPPGTGWAHGPDGRNGRASGGYGAALRAALAPLPRDDDRAVLVVSLGYDTLVTDPEAGKRGENLALRPEDFAAVGAALGEACPRVLVVQEGGYDLDGVPRAASALLNGLEGGEEV